MSLPRFHLDCALAQGATVTLPDRVAHHALRVLRLGEGEPVVLFNGAGGEFEARLHIEGRNARAQVGRFSGADRESPLAVTLVQAWIASDKLDWVVQKATELGAARLLLLPAQRSVVRLGGERRDKRLEHLRQLAIAACEQCGRNRLPAVDAADDLDAALASLDAGPRFMLVPGAALPLAAATPPPSTATVLIGPEGGFADGEIARARAFDCVPVALGPRILRTETAGLAALATLQARFGDLGA